MAAKKQDSKSAKVRELLSLGAPAADIAKQVGCTPALVYNVKARMGGGGERKPGRPPKAAPMAAGNVDSFIAALRHGEAERERLHSALQRIAALIEAAL